MPEVQYVLIRLYISKENLYCNNASSHKTVKLHYTSLGLKTKSWVLNPTKEPQASFWHGLEASFCFFFGAGQLGTGFFKFGLNA